MKFTVNRDHFASALALVQRVTGGKSLPILSHVLIETDGAQLVLTAHNMDFGLRCRVAATVQQAGAVTLPAKRLLGLVRELPNVEVAVVIGRSHNAEIKSGGSRFKVMGMAKDEFPPMTASPLECTPIVLNQEAIRTALRTVEFAQSPDETRYILNAVLWDFDPEGRVLKMVATDGRRLALNKVALDLPSIPQGRFILPTKAVGECAQLLQLGTKVEFAFNERRAEFTFETDKSSDGLVGSVTFYSKLVEGNYPDYRRVFPTDLPVTVKLKREDTLAVAHRVALVCSEKNNSLKLNFDENALTISAASPDFGEANEVMSVENPKNQARIAFNPTYFMEPLRALVHDAVTFRMSNENLPATMEAGDSFFCVLMPVRIT